MKEFFTLRPRKRASVTRAVFSTVGHLIVGLRLISPGMPNATKRAGHLENRISDPCRASASVTVLPMTAALAASSALFFVGVWNSRRPESNFGLIRCISALSRPFGIPFFPSARPNFLLPPKREPRTPRTISRPIDALALRATLGCRSQNAVATAIVQQDIGQSPAAGTFCWR